MGGKAAVIASVPDGTNKWSVQFFNLGRASASPPVCDSLFYLVLISHYQRKERETQYAVLLLPRNPTREPTLFNPLESQRRSCA